MSGGSRPSFDLAQPTLASNLKGSGMVKALRKMLCVVVLLNLWGCAATLIPSNEGGSFLLEEDVLYLMKSNLVRVSPPMRGLTRGEYIAVGHNSDGIFYRGPRGCVLLFTPEDGALYLKTGERRVFPAPDPLSAGPDDEGGVFVPYDPTEEPYFYVYQDWRGHTGDANAKVPSRPRSDVNTYKGDPTAREEIPINPLKVIVIHPASPGAPPTPVGALGVGIGMYAGRAMTMPLVRRVQGKPLLTAYVDDEKLQTFLRKVMREQRNARSSFDPAEGEPATGR